MILLTVALALMGGLLMSRLAKLLKLPAVTAYLITGILIGPFCLGALGIEGLGFVSSQQVESLTVLSQMALGFIAFEIGNEFRLEQLKSSGKKVLWIGIMQALVTTLLVDAVLIALHFIMPDALPLQTAILLGAIAAATAPAATLMVVKQYKAQGELTNLLLKVVALDDAVGLVVFAISSGIANAIGSGSIDFVSVLVEPSLEIVLSLLIGGLLGLALTGLERMFFSRSKRTGIIVGVIMLAVGISLLSWDIGRVTIGFSTLLMLMSMGTVFCNTCPLSEDLMQRSDRWASPLMVLFFVLSGAQLKFSAFGNGLIVIISVVYIAIRSAAKILGAYGSAKMVHCEKKVTDNLGIALLPQAGVALGMISVVKEQFGSSSQEATVVMQVVLLAVLIYELAGPILTKFALTRAGDIVTKAQHLKRNKNAVVMDRVPQERLDSANKRLLVNEKTDCVADEASANTNGQTDTTAQS